MRAFDDVHSWPRTGCFSPARQWSPSFGITVSNDDASPAVVDERELILLPTGAVFVVSGASRRASESVSCDAVLARPGECGDEGITNHSPRVAPLDPLHLARGAPRSHSARVGSLSPLFAACWFEPALITIAEASNPELDSKRGS